MITPARTVTKPIILRTTSPLTGEVVTYTTTKRTLIRPAHTKYELPIAPTPLPEEFFFHRINQRMVPHLIKSLDLMVNARSVSALSKDKYVRYVMSECRSSQIDTIFGTLFGPCRDHHGFQIPVFHTTTPQNWKITKDKVMQLIKLFELEALLVTNEIIYGNRLGSRDRRTFRRVDGLIAYFILSLVHCKLFKTNKDELSFFKALQTSLNKTQDCLQMIDYSISKELSRPSRYKGQRLLINQFLMKRQSDVKIVCDQEFIYQAERTSKGIKPIRYVAGNGFLNSSWDWDLEDRVGTLERRVIKDKAVSGVAKVNDYLANLEITSLMS